MHTLTLAEQRGEEKIITSGMKRRIKRELGAEKPTVWVGKGGATPQIMDEIERQLDKRKMVKAKLLKTALQNEEARDVASRIASQTESSLIEVRGHTFILYKSRKKPGK